MNNNLGFMMYAECPLLSASTIFSRSFLSASKIFTSAFSSAPIDSWFSPASTKQQDNSRLTMSLMYGFSSGSSVSRCSSHCPSLDARVPCLTRIGAYTDEASVTSEMHALMSSTCIIVDRSCS
ncbi:hypothetical protein KP509_05G102700 [Ceratopteris richardii]|uniref:Uncharacterized protein n=1 Tax=Ceratopteris richardii TaxID=49495 RepID=A0A8T2UWE0_CERRI|nr:hypothetical protein KP509_05G102700 [Ceratopteris richardii]